MSFKDYFIKNVVITFFIITACVSVGAGVMGCIFMPNAKLSYDALFTPALYGLATSLPSLVSYSKRELSVRGAIIRQVIEFFLIEAMVLSVNYIGGNLTDLSITVSLFFTVLIIYVTVYVIQFIGERRVANELNDALKKIKSEKKQ